MTASPSNSSPSFCHNFNTIQVTLRRKRQDLETIRLACESWGSELWTDGVCCGQVGGANGRDSGAWEDVVDTKDRHSGVQAEKQGQENFEIVIM